MNKGWIVEVHSQAGVLLYVARCDTAGEAEEIVRESFDVSESIDVFVLQAAGEETLLKLKVPAGGVKGPM